MRFAFLIFDRITALDAVGPYEVLSRLPGAEVSFIAAEPGPKRTDTGALALTADLALDELTDPDVVLVPGGEGNRPLLGDDEVLGWLRGAHRTSEWTTSVCTGSLLLGAAGFLKNKRATTNRTAVEELRPYCAQVIDDRVVDEGAIITARGVTSAVDLGLYLVERLVGAEARARVATQMDYPYVWEYRAIRSRA